MKKFQVYTIQALHVLWVSRLFLAPIEGFAFPVHERASFMVSFIPLPKMSNVFNFIAP